MEVNKQPSSKVAPIVEQTIFYQRNEELALWSSGSAID
jgi:hypothetical protein